MEEQFISSEKKWSNNAKKKKILDEVNILEIVDFTQ